MMRVVDPTASPKDKMSALRTCSTALIISGFLVRLPRRDATASTNRTTIKQGSEGQIRKQKQTVRSTQRPPLPFVASLSLLDRDDVAQGVCAKGLGGTIRGATGGWGRAKNGVEASPTVTP